MREIWPFEAKLHRGYVVTGSHTGSNSFCLFGLIFFGPLVGLKSCWIVAAIQEPLLASFDAKYLCQVEDKWLLFTIGMLWKIFVGHGISFGIFHFFCILLYYMCWEVLSKLLILDFIMENKFSWEGYFQIKVLFKIGMMLLLRNFLYGKNFFFKKKKLWENLVSFSKNP